MRPGVPAVRLENLGHYPQVEDPRRFVEALTRAMAASPSSL
jgi:pimeloyl-ACP methyl ester carboxylesterase